MKINKQTLFLICTQLTCIATKPPAQPAVANQAQQFKYYRDTQTFELSDFQMARRDKKIAKVSGLKKVLPVKELQRIVTEYLGWEPIEEKTPSQKINSIDFSQDGQYILIDYSSGSIFNVEIWQRKLNKYHEYLTTSIGTSNAKFSNNGKYFLSADYKKIDVYTIANGKLSPLDRLKVDSDKRRIIISSNGNIAVVNDQSAIEIWKLKDEMYQKVNELKEIPGNITKLEFAPNNTDLAVLANNLLIWNISKQPARTQHTIYTPAGSDKIVYAFDGTYISVGGDKNLNTYAIVGNKIELVRSITIAGDVDITIHAFTGDGSSFVTRSNGTGETIIWDYHDSKFKPQVIGNYVLRATKFSLDQNYFVAEITPFTNTYQLEPTLKIWRNQKRELEREIEQPNIHKSVSDFFDFSVRLNAIGNA